MSHLPGNKVRLLASFVILLAAGSVQAQAVPIGPPPPVIIGQQGPPPPVVVGTPVSEVRSRPVIERIEPTAGQAGTTVTIVGRNFQAGDQVFFGGASLTVQSVVPTRITIILPDGVRSGRFTVQGPGVSAESSQTFNVVQPPPPPTISGFAPAAGEPGTDVAIEGASFSLRIYENRVSMNGLVIPVRSASTTRLTVTIPEGAADGTFAVEVLPGTYRLVTQKGQFRRIRDITVPETGPAEIDEDHTTLPSRNAPDDTIPHIALVWALEGGDHIEDVLAKMQMGTVGSDDRLVRGSEQFDIYNITGYPPNTELLENLDRMLQYHILFFPCTIWGGGLDEQLNDPTGPLSDPAVLANLRAYANAGGKIYATDMMYDIFEQPMPDYLDMCGDDASLNDADQTAWADMRTASGWTSHGRSVDADLSAWLDANVADHSNIDFLENFVWIEAWYDTPDPDPAGPVPPKIWVEGDLILEPSRTLPLTVTWPYGAGKVLFSTYHTVGEGGHAGIYPQEYVLIYLIMEIGVCQDPFF